MIAPSWLSTPTQPIAVDDVIAYLKMAPGLADSTGHEIQIGGPDILSYGDMLDRMAYALKINPRPRIPVPLLSLGSRRCGSASSPQWTPGSRGP